MFKNIDELSEGGRGLKIMLHITDELSYTRSSEQQNCLTIVKNYTREDLSQSPDIPKGSVLKGLSDFFNRLNRFKNKHQQQQSCDTLLQTIVLQVNTELIAVNQVLNWYKQLEELPIPRSVIWESKLALVEGFTNAVRHAHKNLPSETPIELEVKVFNERLEIRILDYGKPFDLEAKLSELREIEPEPFQSEEERVLSMLQLADQ